MLYKTEYNESIKIIKERLNELYNLRINGKLGVIEYHMLWTREYKKLSELKNNKIIIVDVEKINNNTNVRKLKI